MRAAKEKAAEERRAGISSQLLLFLAALLVAVPAAASIPTASDVFAEATPLVLEDLESELATYRAEACAAQIAARAARPSRRLELYPPRIRAALEESLPRLEWPVSPKSRVWGFELVEFLQPSWNQQFRLDFVEGMLYVRNRYLDPETGRFISTDPLEYVDAPSLYQYSLNSTANFRDPLGLVADLPNDGLVPGIDVPVPDPTLAQESLEFFAGELWGFVQIGPELAVDAAVGTGLSMNAAFEGPLGVAAYSAEFAGQAVLVAAIYDELLRDMWDQYESASSFEQGRITGKLLGVATAIAAGRTPQARALLARFQARLGLLSQVDDVGRTCPISPKEGQAGGPGAGKRFSEKLRDTARAESGDTCVFCDTPTTREPGPTQSNIDHSIPKSRAGNNTLENAQNACRTCNLDKRTMTTEEYLEELAARAIGDG